jgi:anion-transporting  ArsA/GET3 family ATPase
MALARLILITGKGGTGKSAVAAALALALARRRPTLLVDLDQRMWAARMLGVEPERNSNADGAEDGAARANAMPNLETASLSAHAELEAFIERIVPLKSIARRMLNSHTFGYVSAALPGLEAFLMLERLRLIAGQAALEDRYAVVDAPATGSTLELLSVAGGVKRIAPLGTLNRLAKEVESFLTDPGRLSVMLTLSAQELALREALQAADVLRSRLKVSVAAAVVNGVPPPLFTAADLRALAANPCCHRLAQWRSGSARNLARTRQAASRAGLPMIELPMLFSPALGRAELEELSRALDARLDRS